MKYLAISFFLGLSGLIFAPNTSDATPLNRWKISCGVDRGSITQKGSTRTFKTSKNKCPGGIFKQRAEIYSGNVRPDIKGAYLFSATVSMKTVRDEKYDIFQVHDGRRGCAPPLKVEVLRNGQLKLVSDIKTGPGESCIRGTLTNKISKAKISRDGRDHKLEVLIDFNGKGGFGVIVWIDGKRQVSGQYSPKENSKFRPKKYYFKHGVYSQHMFDYVFVSKNMRVRRK